MNSSNDLLSVTAFGSALLHAVIILGISFKLPEIANVENADNTLDVVLINNSNNEVPDNAETVSANNNQGGGIDKLVATSPLPYKPVDVSPIDAIKLTARQQLAENQTKDKLLSGNSDIPVMTPNTPEKEKPIAPEPQNGNHQTSTRDTKRLERQRLIAKLQRNWQDYQQRPRKEFLSPSSKQNDAADYLEAWRKKVEQVGNSNYPIQARARGLSGTLILSVEINRNGTISTVSLLKPSPNKVLNDAAVRFVRSASPYSSFPPEIDPQTDILVITRAFHFLSNNTVTSSDASSTQ